MFKTKSEKYLFVITLLLALGFGGIYAYRSLGETWLVLNDDLTDTSDKIEQLLDVQSEAIEIKAKFDEMEEELKLPGSDTQQEIAIRQTLSEIFEKTGIKGQRIQPKQHQTEDDFKIITYQIDDIECTPLQLGQLLYSIERKSKVMEVDFLRIDNQMHDNGSMGMNRRNVGNNPNADTSLLMVDMHISRLIEYREGEAPEDRETS